MARKRDSPALHVRDGGAIPLHELVALTESLPPDPPPTPDPPAHSGPYAALAAIPGKEAYDAFYREYDALLARCGEHGRNRNYLDAARRFEEEAFYYDRLGAEQRRAGADNPGRTGTRAMALSQLAREARRQRDRMFAVAKARVAADRRAPGLLVDSDERTHRERMIASREDM